MIPSLDTIKLMNEQNRSALQAHIRALSPEPRSYTHQFHLNTEAQIKSVLALIEDLASPMGQDLGDNLKEMIACFLDGESNQPISFDFTNGKGIIHAYNLGGFHLEEFDIPDVIILIGILKLLDTKKEN